MDAFYASVEQRNQPELRGKPVVVGGSPEDRGVVAAASYEARKFGVRSAIPMSKALRLCPQAVLVTPHFDEYRKASETIRAVFREYTQLIEPISLDEAYLDVSHRVESFAEAEKIGFQIKTKIKERTQLNASVGIGPNKYIAKIASDFHKPNGFCVIPPEQVLDFITPLPVRRIPGVGEKTEQRLHILEISTIGQLREVALHTLQDAFGAKYGERIYELARGFDDAPVIADRPRKSLSQERTFRQDIEKKEEMQRILRVLAHEVAQLLEENDLQGRIVGIKVRYGDFRIATRVLTLDHRTRDAKEIAALSLDLLEKLDLTHRKVRLLGVRIAGFDPLPEKKKVPSTSDLQLLFWEQESIE